MKKVLLTGISGYIAMHCAKELLKRDYHINATVRNLDKVEDIKNALSAIADCEYVMHVASPYPLNQPKDENVLIKPAVEGTERVVSLAIKNNVKKIVLTSSVAAISSGHTKKTYSEEDWSLVDKPIPTYPKSKALAEMKAWDLIKNSGSNTVLSVINPAGVIGPSLTSEISSTQLIIAGLMNGRIPVNLPVHIGYVDVTDDIINTAFGKFKILADKKKHIYDEDIAA